MKEMLGLRYGRSLTTGEIDEDTIIWTVSQERLDAHDLRATVEQWWAGSGDPLYAIGSDLYSRNPRNFEWSEDASYWQLTTTAAGWLALVKMAGEIMGNDWEEDEVTEESDQPGCPSAQIEVAMVIQEVEAYRDFVGGWLYDLLEDYRPGVDRGDWFLMKSGRFVGFTEREIVELCFGLGGGELEDKPWEFPAYNGHYTCRRAHWFEGTYEELYKPKGAFFWVEHRTVIDDLYPIFTPTPPGWALVTHHTWSGETGLQENLPDGEELAEGEDEYIAVGMTTPATVIFRWTAIFPGRGRWTGRSPRERMARRRERMARLRWDGHNVGTLKILEAK